MDSRQTDGQKIQWRPQKLHKSLIVHIPTKSCQKQSTFIVSVEPLSLGHVIKWIQHCCKCHRWMWIVKADSTDQTSVMPFWILRSFRMFSQVLKKLNSFPKWHSRYTKLVSFLVCDELRMVGCPLNSDFIHVIQGAATLRNLLVKGRGKKNWHCEHRACGVTEMAWNIKGVRTTKCAAYVSEIE